MYIFNFNKKLSQEDEIFWKKYIKTNKLEYNNSKSNSTNKIINLTNEIMPLQPLENLIEYLNKYEKINNNILESITFKVENKLLNKKFDVIIKDTYEILNNNMKTFFFIKRINKETKYKNKNFQKYICNIINSNNGFNKLDKIYIINLEHRIDRKESILNEMNKLGICNNKIQIIKAIYRKDYGAIGCGLSHILALEDAIKNNYNKIAILEDDYILNIDADDYNDKIDNILNLEWDVFLLAANIEKAENTNYNNILKITKARTTSGYILNNNMFEVLKDNFKEACDNMELYKDKTKYDERIIKHNYAIDMYWQKLQNNYLWLTYNNENRIGKQLPSYSDIENRFTSYGV